MYLNTKASVLFLFGSLFSVGAQATLLDIQDDNIFFNSSTLGITSLLHEGNAVTEGGINDFFDTGIQLIYTNTLDVNNLGTMTWSFTNNTGSSLENAWLGGFLDSDIDSSNNTFFNEYGELVDVSGTGTADNKADSWEIDEPGYLFGDIYYNLEDGYLDNFNNVDSTTPDDVSFGLGFDLGTLTNGSTWDVVFEISTLNIGGLSISDPDSGASFYWNGTATVNNNQIVDVSPVPEPATLAIFVMGILTLVGIRRNTPKAKN
jgi:hypothetical protein